LHSTDCHHHFCCDAAPAFMPRISRVLVQRILHFACVPSSHFRYRRLSFTRTPVPLIAKPSPTPVFAFATNAVHSVLVLRHIALCRNTATYLVLLPRQYYRAARTACIARAAAAASRGPADDMWLDRLLLPGTLLTSPSPPWHGALISSRTQRANRQTPHVWLIPASQFLVIPPLFAALPALPSPFLLFSLQPTRSTLLLAPPSPLRGLNCCCPDRRDLHLNVTRHHTFWLRTRRARQPSLCRDSCIVAFLRAWRMVDVGLTRRGVARYPSGSGYLRAMAT